MRRSQPRIIAELVQVTDYSNFGQLLSEGQTDYLSPEVWRSSAGSSSCKLASFDSFEGLDRWSSSFSVG